MLISLLFARIALSPHTSTLRALFWVHILAKKNPPTPISGYGLASCAENSHFTNCIHANATLLSVGKLHVSLLAAYIQLSDVYENLSTFLSLGKS